MTDDLRPVTITLSPQRRELIDEWASREMAETEPNLGSKYWREPALRYEEARAIRALIADALLVSSEQTVRNIRDEWPDKQADSSPADQFGLIPHKPGDKLP